MRRILTTLAITAFAVPVLAGTAVASTEALLSNPGQAQDAKAYCVTNHGELNGPGAIGDAQSTRKGQNGVFYRNGGVVEQACEGISQG